MKLYVQQVAHMTEMSEVPGSISGSAYTSVDIESFYGHFSPSTDSRSGVQKKEIIFQFGQELLPLIDLKAAYFWFSSIT